MVSEIFHFWWPIWQGWWWVGGLFLQKIIPLGSPILQAETYQISTRLKFQDKDRVCQYINDDFSLLWLLSFATKVRGRDLWYFVDLVQVLIRGLTSLKAWRLNLLSQYYIRRTWLPGLQWHRLSRSVFSWRCCECLCCCDCWHVVTPPQRQLLVFWLNDGPEKKCPVSNIGDSLSQLVV